LAAASSPELVGVSRGAELSAWGRMRATQLGRQAEWRAGGIWGPAWRPECWYHVAVCFPEGARNCLAAASWLAQWRARPTHAHLPALRHASPNSISGAPLGPLGRPLTRREWTAGGRAADELRTSVGRRTSGGSRCGGRAQNRLKSIGRRAGGRINGRPALLAERGARVWPNLRTIAASGGRLVSRWGSWRPMRTSGAAPNPPPATTMDPTRSGGPLAGCSAAARQLVGIF